jgi:tetratricopeptide (TPR) repeat protein
VSSRDLVAWLVATVTWLAIGCTAIPAWRDVERAFALNDWSEARLHGFVVSTNAPRADSTRLAGRLSSFLDLLDTSLGGRFEGDRNRRVFLFSKSSQFQYFTGGGELGHTGRNQDVIFVGLPADLGSLAIPVLFHELVHVALFENDRLDYAPWYHEGMAEMLSSAVFRENVAAIGRIPTIRRSTLAEYEPLALETIFGTTAISQLEEEVAARFYADAWVMVRFLHGGLSADLPNYYEAMLTFLAQLHAGQPWEAAFDQAFSISRDKFASQFAAFRRSSAAGIAFIRYVELPVRPPEIRFTRLTASEAARRLGAYARRVRALALASDFYDFATRRDPADEDSRVRLASVLAEAGRPDAAASELARVNEAVSSSPLASEARGLIALARCNALGDEPHDLAASEHTVEVRAALLADARRHFRAALARDEERPASWRGLLEALLEDTTSDPAEGLRTLGAARPHVEHTPWLELPHARLLLRAGRDHEGRALLESLIGSEVSDRAVALLEKIDVEQR